MSTSSRQRPRIQIALVRALCVLLLLQGYPVWALEQLDVRAEPRIPPIAERAWAWLDDAGATDGSWFRSGAQWLHAGERLTHRWTAAVHAAGRDGELLLESMFGGAGAAMALPGDVPSGPPEPPGFGKDASRLPAETFVADSNRALKAALDEIPLVPGWNLLSVPEEPSDTSPASVLATIGGGYERIYAYDACDMADPWKVYDPNDPAATDLTTLDHRMGFWADATLPVDLLSDGTLPATTSFELCVGWNLIGFPAGQARPVRNALSSIEGKYVRVLLYEAFDAKDPWKIYDVDVPGWANDLDVMEPGRGYWVLVTEPATVVFANDGPPPSVSLTAPGDLAVITAPTDVLGTVESPVLKDWTLSYHAVGDLDWLRLESGLVPVVSGKLAVFDPTLLLNGMYEIRLAASDYQGRTVESEPIAVTVEGNMKIGHFTLSFVDLAIPLSGLDIEIIRTYDSRKRLTKADFGQGWTLEVKSGSYRNNRPPGEGWNILAGFLPCQTTNETRSHLTTIRLSDQELYKFRPTLLDLSPTLGGCFARLAFQYIDGPSPNANLQILGNDRVFYGNTEDELIDTETLEIFEPRDVRLTTRDGRQFHLNLEDGVKHLKDTNGNTLTIDSGGIAHSSGPTVAFDRDSDGNIVDITDPEGHHRTYAYGEDNDLISTTDRNGAATRYTYQGLHYLTDLENAIGNHPIRTEYDNDGRVIRMVDSSGKEFTFDHEIQGRREIVTNRLGFSRSLQYDNRGNVIWEMDESGAITTRLFDSQDHLLSEKDPLGRVISQAYAPSGDLESQTDALGNTTQFTYDQRGQVLTVTNPDGSVLTKSYDDRGNLVGIKDPLGSESRFSYDNAGNLKTYTDTLRNTTSYEYNRSGNRVAVTDQLGNKTYYTYNLNGRPTTEVKDRGTPGPSKEDIVTSFSYDAVGHEISRTLPDGTITSKTFDALGNATQIVDANGNIKTLHYDDLGRLATVTFPDGTSESTIYDAEGQVAGKSDREGRLTIFSYDRLGRMLSITYPDGAIVRNVYDAAGQIVSRMDPRGSETTFAYDLGGHQSSVVDSLGSEVKYTYNYSGSRLSSTDARGNTRKFVYDALQRLVEIVFPDESRIHFTYDAAGRTVAITDQAGRSTHYTYDAFGHLTSVVDTADQITYYTYDDAGNLVSQADSKGHITSFEYDSRGRRTARILPDGLRETVTYSPSGKISQRTDFEANTTTFFYDANDRLVRLRHSNGTESVYTYTATGQRASVTDARGVTSFKYDNRDRLIEKVEPTGYKMSYEYDISGNVVKLTQMVADQSFSTSYTYDAINKITSVTDPQGDITRLEYDPGGNMSKLSFPNGITTEYGHNPLGRLSTLSTSSESGELVQDYIYSMNATGGRIGIEEAPQTYWNFEYDNLYRLTADTVSSQTSTLDHQEYFNYDQVGNIIQRVTGPEESMATFQSTFDERDRILTMGSETYQWSKNGSLLSIEGDTRSLNCEWDDKGRLSHVVHPDREIWMTYDADGNRVRSVIDVPDGKSTVIDYLIDSTGPLSQLTAEIVDGEIAAIYTRAEGRLISVLRPPSGEKRFFHLDALGSVRALSDTASIVTDRYWYTSFGELLQHEGDDINPFLFAGEYFDPNVELYYNRARWLDTRTGRFISQDASLGSLSNPLSLHRYLYADADPINSVDPTGNVSLLGAAVRLAIIGIAAALLISLGDIVNNSFAPSRGLTDGEKALAIEIFGEGTINLDKVRVYYTKYIWFQEKSRPIMAPDGNLYVHPYAREEAEDLSEGPHTLGTRIFIHEMTHVWQHQKGIPVRWLRPFTWEYCYTLEEDSQFEEFNIEQQAEIVADYSQIRKRHFIALLKCSGQRITPEDVDLFESVIPFVGGSRHEPIY